MNEQYLTIKQVAKIIGVTPLTLRNWDKKGVLAAYRNPVNNYRLYRYADVADFISAIKRSGPRQPETQRLAVRQEEEPMADSSRAALETEPALLDEEIPGTGFGEEPPALHDDAAYADALERQASEPEEQPDADAV